MAGRKRSAKALDDAVANAFDEVRDAGFATGALLAMKHRFAAVPSAALVDAMFKALAARQPVGVDEVTAFATWLVLMVGIDTARQGCLSHHDGSADSLILAERLGLDLADEVAPDAVTRFAEAQAPEMRQVLTADAAGPVTLAQGLLEVPAVLRQAMVAAVFAGSRPTKARRTFAALALLFPFDAGTKGLALDWLAAHDDPEVRHFLTTLPASAVDPETGALIRQTRMRLGADTAGNAKGLPGVPLTWPVVDAFATPGDGQGGQGLYLVRRIASRKVALVGAVCDDRCGIAGGLHLTATLAEVQDLLAGMFDGDVAVAPVAPAHVVQRIEQGIALAREKHLPLPHDFQLGRYLLAGLDDSGAPDVGALVRQWADAAKLPDTHYLLHTLAGTAWYYGLEDGPGEDFFQAAATALDRITIEAGALEVPQAIAQEADDPDGQLLWLQRQDFQADLIAAEAERVFTSEERRLWCGRLAEAAYWFDCADMPTMRDLAATAAVAIDPDSGVPLAEQPLLAAMLRLSVLRLDEAD